MMHFQIYDEAKWDATWPELEDRSGNYRLFACDTNTGVPRRILRVVAEDYTGTLNIGAL